MNARRGIQPVYGDEATAEQALRVHIAALDHEILLAEKKVSVIRDAIALRRNARARLETQLALVASPVRSAL